MKNITIVYPVWFGLRHKKLNATHPDQWEELTAEQLVALVQLMNGTVDEESLMSLMLGLPKRVVRRLDPFQRYKLGELLDFLSSRAPINRFILKFANGLEAPADGLDDVGFGEFIHIDTFYMDYLESQKPEHRLKLVSCLYVMHKDGKRPDFTGRIDTLRSRHISDIEQEAIVLNYGLIRTWLSKAYPEVFPEPKEGSENKRAKLNGWLEVFDSLVGDDIVNAERYALKPCMEILRYMNRKIKENRKKRKKS
ncbi:MAG: hypothetical protein ACWA6U_08015 [Breznakibacter sp.]